MAQSQDESHLSPTNQLFEELYDELKKIARSHMALQSGKLTLQPTALINEAFLKLKQRRSNEEWSDRNHFLRSAAVVMRRILIDHARAKTSEKRGGDSEPVELSGFETKEITLNDNLLAVHEALVKFEKESPTKAELVSLRFFAGLTVDEAAEALSISPSTAKQWWGFSKAWLKVELSA